MSRMTTVTVSASAVESLIANVETFVSQNPQTSPHELQSELGEVCGATVPFSRIIRALQVLLERKPAMSSVIEGIFRRINPRDLMFRYAEYAED